MRARIVAAAFVLSLSLVAAAPMAAADEPQPTDALEVEPCILTGVGCFVLLLADAVLDRAVACVQDLQCTGLA